MTPTLRVDGDVRTHVGLVRQENEDSLIARPDMGLWAVADGMGGHAHGGWASSCITEALGEVLEGPSDLDVRLARVAEAIHAANARIFNAAIDQRTQMGSTVVALMVAAGRFGVLWAGDSRAYLLRDNILHRLTVDHTQVQQMFDDGLIRADELETHPFSHVLGRAVGVERTVQLDAVTDTALAGDRFLLCSDGLTRVVSDAELTAALVTGAPGACADALVALVLGRGAPDNVTMAIVDVREGTVLVFASDGNTP